MEIISPIIRLIQVLEQVKQSAKQHEWKLKKNEAITRAVLIDPVIRALGWDTTNPDMVEFERYYKDTKLDYALNDPKGDVRIIVEAKAFGVNLNDDKIFTIILTYGITYKIPSIFLTDGLVWKHYKLAEFNKIDPVVLDLKKDSLVDCALYLITNLDAALYWYDGKPTPQQEVVKPVEAAPVTLPPAVAPQLPEKIAVKEILPPVNSDFVLLSSLAKTDLKGHMAPKVLRLPDGSIKQIKYWREILHQSILFVLANTANLHLPLPDKVGKKNKIVDYQKMDQPGIIVNGTYQGKEVFIFLNYSANNTVKNAEYVLSFLPQEVCKFPVAVKF